MISATTPGHHPATRGWIDLLCEGATVLLFFASLWSLAFVALALPDPAHPPQRPPASAEADRWAPAAAGAQTAQAVGSPHECPAPVALLDGCVRSRLRGPVAGD